MIYSYIDKYNKYNKKIIKLTGGNKKKYNTNTSENTFENTFEEESQNKKINCLSQDQKRNFFTKINEYYNYHNNVIEIMMNKQNLLCDNKIIKEIDILDEDNVYSISRLLKKTTKFFDENNIEYWLDGGTLLGAVRDNKFIPWDDDADIGITEQTYYKLRNIMLKMKEKEIDGKKFHVNKELKLKFRENTLPEFRILDKSKDFYMVKVYNYKDKKIKNNDVFIDIIVYYKSGNRYISNHKEWERRYYYNENEMYPLKKIDFEGRKYNIINEPEKYLNRGYFFWKHIGVADHSHFSDLKKTRNKNLYFVLSSYDKEYNLF